MQTEDFTVRYNNPDGSKLKSNPFLKDLSSEFKNKGNSNFWGRVVSEINSLDESKFNLKSGRTFKNGLKAAIGLTGEYGLIGYTIRHAQSNIRLDRQPSNWSHSFIFSDTVPADSKKTISKKKSSPIIWESSIGLTSSTPQLNLINGAGPRYLSDYNKSDFNVFSGHCVPNLAAIIVALNNEEVEKILKRASEPNADQINYDFTGLLGIWYSYIFNKRNEINPLGNGKPLYSAAYCQLAYDAVGIDLAAGINSRNTSPESIWGTAKIFYDHFNEMGYPIIGYYCVRDPYCQMIPLKEKDTFTISMNKANEMIRGK